MLCAIILFFSVTTSVSAAPYFSDRFPFHHHHPLYQPPPPMAPLHLSNYDDELSREFMRDMFDTSQFLIGIKRHMMNEFHRCFPTVDSSDGFFGATYKITVQINGFERNEITVKTENSFLIVEAVHKGEFQKHQVIVKRLPKNVDKTGTWTYDGNILTIILPVMKSIDDDKNNAEGQESTEIETNTQHNIENTSATRSSTETETNDEHKSREQIEYNQSSDNLDADVGVKTGAKVDGEIETNVISTEDPFHTFTYSPD